MRKISMYITVNLACKAHASLMIFLLYTRRHQLFSNKRLYIANEKSILFESMCYISEILLNVRFWNKMNAFNFSKFILLHGRFSYFSINTSLFQRLFWMVIKFNQSLLIDIIHLSSYSILCLFTESTLISF